MLILRSTHERKIARLEQELFLLENEVRTLKEEKDTWRKNIMKYSQIAFSAEEKTTFFLYKKGDFYICRHRDRQDEYSLIANNLKHESFISERISTLQTKIERNFVDKSVLYVFIHDIQMSESDRDIGIGTSLLKTFKSICKEKGFCLIKGNLVSGDIKDHGDRLFHFYEKNGFEIKAKESSGDLEIECHVCYDQNIEV